MLETAQNIVRKTGKKLGLSDKQIESLLKTDAEHTFDIKLSNGRVHKAFRVQHNNRLGPYKGGIRFHPHVNLEEVKALATLMSLKAAAVGLPLGGGKGGVAVDPKQLSISELEELSRAYVAYLKPHIGPDKDIPAPDVNTDARIIDWMVDEYEQLTGDTSKASFTGKSVENSGSWGRDAATGRGGAIVLERILQHLKLGKKPVTIAIQGFGNVGAYFGLIAEEDHPEWKLVAATDSSGGVIAKDGLSAHDLQSYKNFGGRLFAYGKEGTKPVTNEDLINQKVDVLVLAALGDVITHANASRVNAKIIIELANAPINESAYAVLDKHHIMVIPDIIANAGGVIVSYLEWLQNKAGEQWDEAKVNMQMEEYLVKAVDDVLQESEASHSTLKEAAFTIAIRRILEGPKGEMDGK